MWNPKWNSGISDREIKVSMKELIGKVILDLEFYKQDDKYSDGDETENRLLEIVSRYD